MQEHQRFQDGSETGGDDPICTFGNIQLRTEMQHILKVQQEKKNNPIVTDYANG